MSNQLFKNELDPEGKQADRLMIRINFRLPRFCGSLKRKQILKDKETAIKAFEKKHGEKY